MCSPKSPRTPRTPKSQGSAHLGQPPPPSPGSGQTLSLALLGGPGRAPLNPALASGSTNARRPPDARLTPLGLADPPRAPEAPGQGLPLRRAPFPGFLLSASGGRWARRAGSGPTAQAPFRRTPSRSPNRPSGASVCRVLKPVGPGSAAPAPPPSRLLRPRPQAGNPRPPEARDWERGTAVTWAPTGSDCGAARRWCACANTHPGRGAQTQQGAGSPPGRARSGEPDKLQDSIAHKSPLRQDRERRKCLHLNWRLSDAVLRALAARTRESGSL